MPQYIVASGRDRLSHVVVGYFVADTPFTVIGTFRSIADLMFDIDVAQKEYVVRSVTGPVARVSAVAAGFLRTVRDGIESDNLSALPSRPV